MLVTRFQQGLFCPLHGCCPAAVAEIMAHAYPRHAILISGRELHARSGRHAPFSTPCEGSSYRVASLWRPLWPVIGKWLSDGFSVALPACQSVLSRSGCYDIPVKFKMDILQSHAIVSNNGRTSHLFSQPPARRFFPGFTLSPHIVPEPHVCSFPPIRQMTLAET